MDSSTDITSKLIAWSKGDETALNEVYPAVHCELRKIARHHLKQFRPDSLFQTTALINEAYIRLVDQTRVSWLSRSHFYAIASKMMRRVLLNHVRDKKRDKRGGGAQHVTLFSGAAKQELRLEEILDVDTALTKFEKLDPLKAEIVVLKYYGGMGNEEVANALGISRASVIRYWRFAKAWLARELSDG